MLPLTLGKKKARPALVRYPPGKAPIRPQDLRPHLHIGNCVARLRKLRQDSFQACVTSPPFYGKRSYGCPPAVFGGHPDCAHVFGEPMPGLRQRWGDLSTLSEKQTSNLGSAGMVEALERDGGQFCLKCGTCQEHAFEPLVQYRDSPVRSGNEGVGYDSVDETRAQRWRHSELCRPCGAWKGELGQEPTSELFVEHLVEVFREVRRVLHPTGLLFLNLGDSRAGSGKGRNKDGTHSESHGDKQGTNLGSMEGVMSKTGFNEGREERTLLGVPDRVKEALVADGWLHVSTIYLPKPNPMCESMRGPRWQWHHIKVLLTEEEIAAQEEERRTQKYSEGSGRHDDRPRRHSKAAGHGGVSVNPHPAKIDGKPAKWIRCPGCSQCLPNGGRVFRNGGGRPTDAVEYLLVLAKSPRWFWHTEAVRNPPAESSKGRRVRYKNAMDKYGSPERPTSKHRSGGDPRHGYGGLAAGRSPGAYNGAGGNMLSWILWSPEYSSDKHYACVDEATECLTTRGWLTHDQLVTGDRIAAFDPADRKASWESLKEVFRYDYDGELVSASCGSLDMLLTPNHRCVVERRKLNGDFSLSIKEAKDLLPSDHIPTAVEWKWGGKPIALEWAELLGWYLAEGHASSNKLTVELYQSMTANPKKCDRIMELLEHVKADFGVATANRMCRGRPTQQAIFQVRGYTAAVLRTLAPDKIPTPDILTWSTRSLEALLRGFIGGDGHVRKDDGRVFFNQKHKQTADLMQAVAIRLGWSASIQIKTVNPDKGYQMWYVNLSRHSRRGMRGTAGSGYGADISLVPYTGIVWCPSVPSGCWIARRNGHVFVTGNTYPSWLPRQAIKASCSEWVCAACLTPYAPVIDGDTHDEPDDGEDVPARTVVDWWPMCRCNASRQKPAVLDPFSGSGTTIKEAQALGFAGVGIDAQVNYSVIASRKVPDLVIVKENE